MIAARERCGTLRAVAKLDGDLAFIRQRFVGGDDKARLPDEARGTQAMLVDGNDRRRRACDDVRQGRGD